ncbi:MAG: hypothetical protein IJR44_05430, partial [Neisseriaceae bacterium]|nr:hypothetical protein [Neisseriaceae bacterium]
IRKETLEQIKTMIGDKKPIVVAVVAEEATGNNAIPRATAQAIGRELGLSVDTNIRQINKVSRTGKGIDHRFAFQPIFGGEVKNGQDYLIVDDTSSVGGTITSLKGYIENRGGNVVGATVMTAYETSLKLPITQKMLDNIESKHGNSMNEYWQKEFGYGIDKLTNAEAGHLRKAPNVEQIRTRIANAKTQAGFGLSEQTVSKTTVQSSNRETNELTDNETPRPPQGGFVLPVENENRQPENPKKDNPMAENQPLDETIPNPATANAMSNADIQAMVQQNQADIAKAEEMMQNNNIQNRQAETPLSTEQRRAMAAENSLYAQANSDRETLLQHNEVLQKHTLTPAEPLQTEHFQPDEFVPDEWQPETNSIDFADDRQIVIDEVEKPEQPEMTPQEKVQAAFETLQNQYNGYRYNPETQRLEIENSKTSEEIHYQADAEKLVYTAVDNGERQTIGDIDIKDLTPEYLALSVENRRLAYNQALLQGAFPNAEKRQQLDVQGDQLDESIRQAKRKTETLSPPVAPPPPLDQRYNAVERKFMDNTTHYGDSTNLGIKKRVDYVDVQNGKTVMFSDKGNKLTTSRNPDAQTVQDMAKVAIAKGWDSVKLRGNKDFKRMAWLELESQGIKTKGYSPSPEDKAMLEKLREQRSLSGMENVSQNRQAENQNPTVIASEQSERGNLPTTKSKTPTIGNLNNKGIATPATQSRNDSHLSGSL